MGENMIEKSPEELVDELQKLRSCARIEKVLKELGFKVYYVPGEYDAHGGIAIRNTTIISWWHNPRMDDEPNGYWYGWVVLGPNASSTTTAFYYFRIRDC